MKSSETKHNLRSSVLDGGGYSVMVGAGETYLPAFALAMGMGNLTAGLVVGAPMVAGGLLQLVSPVAVRRLGSRKNWVVLCAAVQGLAFLPLVAGAMAGWLPPWMLFLVAGVYWGSGLASGPAWNSWMERLFPASLRPKYFAWRSRVCQGCVLAGLLGGGIALQHVGKDALPVFAGLFLVACLCRLFSVAMLWRQTEPARSIHEIQHVSFRDFFFRCWKHTDGRLLL